MIRMATHKGKPLKRGRRGKSGRLPHTVALRGTPTYLLRAVPVKRAGLLNAAPVFYERKLFHRVVNELSKL